MHCVSQMNSHNTKDDIYSHPLNPIEPFKFDSHVARVFDDMIARSIPNYLQMQKSISQLAQDFAQPGTTVWDLGCSTGTTIILLRESLQLLPVTLYGVDNSAAMIEQCRAKLNSLAIPLSLGIPTDSPPPKQTGPSVHLLCADLQEATITNASVVVLNYTLQFLAPGVRHRVLEKIVSGIVPGGLLIVSEKVTHSDPLLNTAINSLYLSFKQTQGYSELEISQKREALENVLIPASIEENLALIQHAGLPNPQLLCKQLNFATFVAIKQ